VAVTIDGVYVPATIEVATFGEADVPIAIPACSAGAGGDR
jgi:hypothetical protein